MAKDHAQDIFRRCFETADGKLVLGKLLIDLGYFDEANTPEQVANRNFANKILKNLGICVDPSTVPSFVQALMNIPVEHKDGKKQD